MGMHSFQQRFLAALATDPAAKSYLRVEVRRSQYGVQQARAHFGDLRFNSNPFRAYQVLTTAIQKDKAIKTRDVGSAITIGSRLHALTGQSYGITGDGHAFHLRPHPGPTGGAGIWVDDSGPHSCAVARSGRFLRFDLAHLASSRLELAWKGSPSQRQRHPFATWVDRVLREGTNDSDPKSMVVAVLPEALRMALQAGFDGMLLNRRRELGILPWGDGTVLATKAPGRHDKPFVFDLASRPRIEAEIYLSRNQLLHGYGSRKKERAMDYATLLRLPGLLPVSTWQDPSDSSPTILVRVDGPKGSSATLIIEPNREIAGMGKRPLTELVTGAIVKAPKEKPAPRR